jgi:hypothetical protein
MLILLKCQVRKTQAGRGRENRKNTNARINSNADVYCLGDPYGYLVADFIAFCQTNKKPVKLDKYKLCGLFTLFPILLQLDRFFLLVIVVSPFFLFLKL